MLYITAAMPIWRRFDMHCNCRAWRRWMTNSGGSATAARHQMTTFARPSAIARLASDSRPAPWSRAAARARRP